MAEYRRHRRNAPGKVGFAQPQERDRPSARRQRQEQLARENARRSARGEPPLKSVEELKDDPPDAILEEAAQIAADLSRLEPRYLSRVRQGS